MSCAKMAEPIKIQFGMMSWVAWYRNGNGQFLGVWPIEKHYKA